MKKKWIALSLLVAMMVLCLTGCTEKSAAKEDGQQPEKVSLQLSVEEYPVMDGSTANLPMMAEVMAEVCDISLEEAENLTSCQKTPLAWENITNGEADILLVYEAAEETKALVEQSGVALEITPIGRDALVFINNAQNPVKDLSQQQLIDIYTGKITNCGHCALSARRNQRQSVPVYEAVDEGRNTYGSAARAEAGRDGDAD